jgi:DNA polymerase I-like protein with 3'-5' exonuclease and polymerase domains
LSPNAVFALGDDALAVLQDLGVAHKGRKIGSLRGKTMMLPSGVPVMVSYSPSIGEVDHGMYVNLLTDTSMVARLAATGSLEAQLGDYRYVEHFKEFQQRVITLFEKNGGKAVDCSLDLETIGLDEFAEPQYAQAIDGLMHTQIEVHPGAYIVSIQLSCEFGKSDVVRFNNRIHEQTMLHDWAFVQTLSWILSTPMISMKGANLKFDLRWLYARAGLTCTNFRFDTTLVGSLLDENRINGLDVHAKIYLPILGGYSDEFDRTVDKSRMDLVPPERLLPYAGGDTDADLQVAAAMKQELLADPKLAGFYVNILHPAARAFEVVERGGIYIDREKFRALEADLNTEAIRIVHKAKQIYGGLLVAKHSDETKAGGMNITKASLITEYMFSPRGLNLKPLDFTDKTHAPSTSMDHLLKFKDVPEAKELVECLSEYGSVTKTLGTYVVGFMKHLRSDGRFHPSYWFFVGDKEDGEGGANTGRLSCKTPAFQTIPVHTKWAPRIQECYIAPDGYVIAAKDYSQGELRTMACIANEPNMLKVYREGLDMHSLTSGRFAGYTYDEMMAMKNSPDKAMREKFKHIRQYGKAGNFGKIYGMGVDGFIAYAFINYGVTLTQKESQEFHDTFFGTYPVLLEYHKNQKAEAKKYKQVRSPLGRIRHLPLIDSPKQDVRAQAERQAINSPNQSTLSDMMLWSFSEMQAQYPELYEQQIIMPFGAVHDSGYDYLLEDRAEELIKYQIEVMQNLPFHKVGWHPQLQFLADGKLGKNMRDMEDV